MKREFARVADSVCDGRISLGYSVESDITKGAFDAFDGDSKFLGTFASRIEARTAIINAANDGR